MNEGGGDLIEDSPNLRHRNRRCSESMDELSWFFVIKSHYNIFTGGIDRPETEKKRSLIHS